MGKIKSSSNNVRVMVRVRPFNSREKDLSREKGEPLKCVVQMDGKVVSVLDPEDDYMTTKPGLEFEYDYCFWSIDEETCEHFPMSVNGFASQVEVYDASGHDALENAWQSYNTCIFAYGQTGSGKSYSMLGTTTGEHMGISPRIVDNLFKRIEEDKVGKPKTIYKVEVTFLEIYNEQVRDLFAKNKNADYAAVKIRQHPIYGVQVHGLEAKVVQTSDMCKEEMEHGIGQRALACTKMNATSSRSHAIFQIHIYTSQADSKQRGHATINLVDLAGSERIGKTGATGQTAEEGKSINLSLSTLRKVIDTLIDNAKGAKKVPPYRESMLTWVLKDSLGGNSKTMMICTISPHSDNLEDTISTLRYGLKAKAIVCKAIKQEVAADKQAKELREKIAELEAQLADAATNGVPSDEMEQLQADIEEKQQAFVEVQQDLQEMAAREAELKQEVTKRRKAQFASAFRSAFQLEKEKKNIKQLEEEKVKISEDAMRLEEELEKSRVNFEQKKAMIEEQQRDMEVALQDAKEKEKELELVQESLTAETERRHEMQKQNDEAIDMMCKELGITRTEIGLSPSGDTVSAAVNTATRFMAGRLKELERDSAEERRRREELERDSVEERRRREEGESELRRLRNTSDETTDIAKRQHANLEAMLQRERQKSGDALEALRDVRDSAKRNEELLSDEVQRLRERSSEEHQVLKNQLEYERKEYRQKGVEQQHLISIANSELDELRKLVKQLQAELYMAEETITDLQHRKDHYKKQCLLLREMHEADTRIIKSLGSERCVSGDVVAAAVKMSGGELGEKSRALQPILEDKVDTIHKLSGALGHYQEAAVEWMSSPNVVGGGSRMRREERAKEKLTVWLQDNQSPPRRNSSRSRSRKRQSSLPEPEVAATYASWQGSPFGVRSSSPESRARQGSPPGHHH
eukprot:TRINITY_DN21957_c1_g1_i1.p1 TRINITY_DN21957_c1_g1~~TRINITY_DN21957_c1_g1_i1.p1  ORF type:complete len:953 (+),score=400.26 TRINITY_DN21957_c1_g1_i1:94-2859(+)